MLKDDGMLRRKKKIRKAIFKCKLLGVIYLTRIRSTRHKPREKDNDKGERLTLIYKLQDSRFSLLAFFSFVDFISLTICLGRTDGPDLYPLIFSLNTIHMKYNFILLKKIYLFRSYKTNS